MSKIIRIGVDLSKLSFDVCGVDASGAVFLEKHLKRKDFLLFSRT